MKQLIIWLLAGIKMADAQSTVHWPVPNLLYVNVADSIVARVPGIPEGRERFLSMYTERKYGLKELTLLVVESYLPVGEGALSVRGSHYGNLNYSQTGGTLCYIRSFGDLLALAGFNMGQQKISNGNPSWLFSCRLSLLWRQQQGWAALILNHLAAFSTSRQKPATKMQVILGYQLSDQLSTSVSLQEDRQAFFSLHYSPADRLFFKAACSVRPSGLSFLAGYRFSKYLLQIMNSYHPLLGLSPAIAISVNW